VPTRYVFGINHNDPSICAEHVSPFRGAIGNQRRVMRLWVVSTGTMPTGAEFLAG
jgi:hypothetical protein